MISAPTISGDGLFLRAIELADWEPYCAMWADPRVTTYIGGEPRSRETSWMKFVQSAGFWSLFGYGYWSIIGADGRYLGLGGLARHERGIDALGDFPECGWVLAPDAWGRGVATAAVAAMCGWADETGISESRCLILNGNVASIKVAEHNGYRCFASIEADTGVFSRLRRPEISR